MVLFEMTLRNLREEAGGIYGDPLLDAKTGALITAGNSASRRTCGTCASTWRRTG